MSNLKNLLPAFYDLTRQTRDGVLAEVRANKKRVDMQDWFARLSNEIIGQTALGHKFKAIEGGEDPYCEAAKKYWCVVCFQGLERS